MCGAQSRNRDATKAPVSAIFQAADIERAHVEALAVECPRQSLDRREVRSQKIGAVEHDHRERALGLLLDAEGVHPMLRQGRCGEAVVRDAARRDGP